MLAGAAASPEPNGVVPREITETARRMVDRLTEVAVSACDVARGSLHGAGGGPRAQRGIREIAEILEAYGPKGSYRAAAELAGCDHHTVARYVKFRAEGRSPQERAQRVRPIDDFIDKIEELVARSGGRIRADVVHRRITAIGFVGGERTPRRAVAELVAANLAPGADRERGSRQGRGRSCPVGVVLEPLLDLAAPAAQHATRIADGPSPRLRQL
ncbi:hypothetical protein GCM10012284_54000 [Mangrovihabitans endophyticus]|uniref:Uncharacterized protein n=1 Tax=Mangrovihabitans endophyticus TaxID=1751298 RepID=A0A8J3C5U7_9ACTN|nr:hypothetical protein GCM10012284_54000 [Mangrovihabitans endophyticus]